MSIIIGFERDQKTANDEYNAYCNEHRELIQEFEQESMYIAERYEGMAFTLAMEELEHRPRFRLHCEEMRRLIRNCEDADRKAEAKAAATGNFEIVDPYWSIAVDHRHEKNQLYEKSKRMVFDMGANRRHEVRPRSTGEPTPLGSYKVTDKRAVTGGNGQ